jgi:signal transduction histidine kinase
LLDPLIDGAPCGYLAFDDAGTLTLVNATLSVALGYPPGTLQGTPLERLLPLPERIFLDTHLRPLLRLEGRADEIYLALRTAGGDALPVLGNAVRRVVDGTPRTECVLLTIRRRGEYEQRLLEARRVAEDSLRAERELIAAREAQAAELRDFAGRLRALAQHLDDSGASERRAAARELHEGIAQELASLRLGLASLRSALERGGDGRPALERLQGVAGRSLERVRELSYELHPPTLEHGGLPTALVTLARDCADREGIAVAADVDPALPRLPSATELAVYRFAEEALDNAARHAAARSIVLAALVSDGALRVEVRDDGIGMSGEDRAAPGGMGLLVASERLGRVGGSLEFPPSHGSGTVVRATVPL